MNTPQYWVVGATWDTDNLEDAFYRRGYWEMGYDDEEKPNFAAKRESIRPNDRIAVKSRDGQGADTISIRSIGIVKEVADRKVFLEWLVTSMDRHVPCKNYFGTIHGPIGDEGWIDRAFRV